MSFENDSEYGEETLSKHQLPKPVQDEEDVGVLSCWNGFKSR